MAAPLAKAGFTTFIFGIFDLRYKLMNAELLQIDIIEYPAAPDMPTMGECPNPAQCSKADRCIYSCSKGHPTVAHEIEQTSGQLVESGDNAATCESLGIVALGEAQPAIHDVSAGP